MAIYVYLLASKKDGTLYTGVKNASSDVSTNIRPCSGFTARHDAMDELVLFKVYDPITVIARETELKKFWCDWKIRSIGKNNRDRVDLDPGRPWILGSTPGVARK